MSFNEFVQRPLWWRQSYSGVSPETELVIRSLLEISGPTRVRTVICSVKFDKGEFFDEL